MAIEISITMAGSEKKVRTLAAVPLGFQIKGNAVVMISNITGNSDDTALSCGFRIVRGETAGTCDNGGTFMRQRGHNLAANAAARAGYNGNLAVQVQIH